MIDRLTEIRGDCVCAEGIGGSFRVLTLASEKCVLVTWVNRALGKRARLRYPALRRL